MRRSEARAGLGRKTYWHEDKARLTGTRIYIILLLESHGNGDGVAVGNCGALFFFPPVWPIRTRHGPYNSVSGEKHLEKGLVWSKNAGKSSHQHKQKTKKRNQNDPQIPQPDLRFAKKQTAKQQRTGPGPNKNQTKQLEICLEYSDLSHCIVIKSMQTN